MKHLDDQLNLFIFFFTKLKNDNRVTLNISVYFRRMATLISIFNWSQQKETSGTWRTSCYYINENINFTNHNRRKQRVNVPKIWFCIKNNKTILIFLIHFQIIDRIWVIEISAIFCTIVRYTVNNIDERHIFLPIILTVQKVLNFQRMESSFWSSSFGVARWQETELRKLSACFVSYMALQSNEWK